MRKKTPIFTFTSLTQTVSTGMPKHLPTLGGIERDIRNGTIPLQRTSQIPKLLPVNLRNNSIRADILGYVSQKKSRSSLPSLPDDGGRVRATEIEGDFDLRMRPVLQFFDVLLPQFLEEVVSLDNEIGERIGLLRRGLCGMIARIRILRGLCRGPHG